MTMRVTQRRSISERDVEVLGCLAAHGGWARPMDLGARDSSHHSPTLAKLVRHGFAERRGGVAHTRASYRYRITAAGRVEWDRRRTYTITREQRALRTRLWESFNGCDCPADGARNERCTREAVRCKGRLGAIIERYAEAGLPPLGVRIAVTSRRLAP